MAIAVEKVGDRIYLRAPWQPGLPELCKAIPGARWSPKAKAWTYACDLEICRQLREIFEDQLVIGEELTKWASRERRRERATSKLVRTPKDLSSDTTNLPTRVGRLCPSMSRALKDRPYQVLGARYVTRARTALLGDQPGLGKTIQTLAALVEGLPTGGRVLVLAPKTAVNSVWRDEIHTWLGDSEVPYTVTSLVGKSPLIQEAATLEYWEMPDDGSLHFMLCNAEMVRIQSERVCSSSSTCNGENEYCQFADKHKGKLVPRMPWLFSLAKGPALWDALVADETHKWLINANSRTKSVSQVGRGFDKLKSTEDGMRIALSGTPLKGKKHNIFGTLHWLRPKVYTSKWSWIENYFQTIENGWGGKEIGGLLKSNSKAFYRALDTVMIRRTKAELRKINPAWMPPEKRYHDVWVDLEGKQAKAYSDILMAAQADLKGGTLSTMGILSEMTRLKQFASCHGFLHPNDGHLVPTLPSAKFDWLLEFLEARGIEEKGDLSDAVQKVIVASQFTQSINVWAGELRRRGIQCYVLTGETTQKERDKQVHEFQHEKDVRVFLINTQAGGSSITLDAADDVVIMDETWVPDEQEQVEDRAHRASNILHQVDIWYVRARGTVEEGIANVNVSKMKSNHVVLDKQRGLKFAREVFGLGA